MSALVVVVLRSMEIANFSRVLNRTGQWCTVVAFLAVSVLLNPAFAGAQDQEPPSTNEEEPLFPEDGLLDEEESAFRGTSREDLDLIEGLLEDSDESIDTGFVYDPSGRRDPFRTLLRVSDSVERTAGPRPEGIPGLLIENLTVTGVWMWPEGPVAQVQSADETISFLLRPGTRVFDGEVISVTWSREEGGKVVFRQVVRDPNSPKPFREVVRRVQL